MKRITLATLVIFFLVLFAGCGKDEQVIDNERPSINIDFAGAFPVQCSELTRGEPFVFKARFSDNVELGSFNVNIHDNFDHHSHSTEIEECPLGEKKNAVNPFEFIRSYDIPANSKTYETNLEIAIPSDVDPGDYHFMITVTDINGWSKMVGLSIKIK